MEQPCFLAARVGDLVVVQTSSDWWVGRVIHAEGGARCNTNSLFQIACIDSGVIRTVNADAVVGILAERSATCSGALESAHNQRHQTQRAGQSNQESNRHGTSRQGRRF